MREWINKSPILRSTARICRSLVPFPGSERYWESRYRKGGTSGPGSYGHYAEFKAETINAFVASQRVNSVIEFGCGDGNQLALAAYPEYLGLDVSETAVSSCRRRFAGDIHKRFKSMKEYARESAELALSLDVILHLVEDDTFEHYMRLLFGASTCFVVIYSSNCEEVAEKDDTHVRHRRFTDWIGDNLPAWNLINHIPNRYPPNKPLGSFADFFIYKRVSSSLS